MDPLNPVSFNHRTELLSTGRRYHFVDQLPNNYDPATTKTLLCIHGFPDLWYGWRYQIKPWVALGYRVVVPDQLGYGGTDKPEDAIEYTPRKVSDDMAALLDLLHIEKAVILGHDWGCFMASRFSMWHPDRLLALVLLSVPFVPPTNDYIALEQTVERFPNWGYQLYFQEKSTNTMIEKHLPPFFKLIFRNRNNRHSPLARWTRPGGLKEILESGIDLKGTGILTQQEFDYYISQFDTRMNGPFNYYRTTSYRFDEEQHPQMLRAPSTDLPVLLIVGKEDPTANQGALGITKKLIPQAQIELIDDVGHWVMVECKEYVNESVPRFLHDALSGDIQTQARL